MKRIFRFRFEFKEEAVSLVVDGGLTLAEVGRRLSVSQQTLRNGIKKHNTSGVRRYGSHNVSDLEAEVSRLPKELAETQLEKEILKRARRPPEGLIHHSDRGSQYCSGHYQKLMKQFKIQPSMSRKGKRWDNAPMESFFGTLKREMVHYRKYGTRKQAVPEISEYIEMFYNRQGRHANRGILSPAAYWKKFIRQQGAA